MSPQSVIHARRLAFAAGAFLLTGFAVPASADAATPSNTATVANGVLTITGSDGPDRIGVDLTPDVNVLRVDFASGSLTFDRAQFDTIAVELGNGNDVFTEARTVIEEPLVVDGGAGNDFIDGGLFTNDILIGGSGNDAFRGEAGDDFLDGGAGNDVVVGGIGRDTALLGSGRDTFQWSPGEGNDVVDGGGSTDQLQFNGSQASEIISVARVETRVVLTRNTTLVRMDLSGIEAVNVQTRDGQDFVEIGDLRGTETRDVAIDLSPDGFGTTGDGKPDVVAVKGSDQAENVAISQKGTQVNVTGLSAAVHVKGSDAADLLAVDAAGGNDRGSIDKNVTAITPSIGLGDGQL